MRAVLLTLVAAATLAIALGSNNVNSKKNSTIIINGIENKNGNAIEDLEKDVTEKNLTDKENELQSDFLKTIARKPDDMVIENSNEPTRFKRSWFSKKKGQNGKSKHSLIKKLWKVIKKASKNTLKKMLDCASQSDNQNTEQFPEPTPEDQQFSEPDINTETDIYTNTEGQDYEN